MQRFAGRYKVSLLAPPPPSVVGARHWRVAGVRCGGWETSASKSQISEPTTAGFDVQRAGVWAGEGGGARLDVWACW